MRSKTLLNRALHLKNKKDFEGALLVLDQLIESDPTSATSHGLRGGILAFELSRWKDAIMSFEKAARLSPRSEMASLGLFHSLWDARRRKAAIAEMERFQKVAHSADYDEIAAELREKGIAV